MTAKITSKGQITIPKKIRDMLKGNIVEFEVIDERVIIKPVLSIGGSMKKYAQKYKPIEEVREMVWGDVAGDIVHEKSKS
jgi:AbrB family looped-hinge helix DNA binding protein